MFFLALIVVSPAVAFRVQKNQASIDTQTPKELRVFASTFNAGNRKYDGSQEMHELAKSLTNGHDKAGEEADIVFVGFQEFSDDKYGLGSWLAKDSWTQLSKTSMDAMKREMEVASTPPAEVHAARDEFAQALTNWHTDLDSEFEKFRESFGDDATDFHAHLTDASAVNKLSHLAKDVVADMSKGIDQRMAEYSAAAKTAPSQQFQGMADAVASLGVKAGQMPDPGTKLAAVKKWTTKAEKQIRAIMTKYPNLAYVREGNKYWRQFLQSFGTTNLVVNDLLNKNESEHINFNAALSGFHEGVKRDVGRSEKHMSDRLKADWDKISKDLSALNKDLSSLTVDGKAGDSLAKGAASGVKGHVGGMRSILHRWQKANEQGLDKLLKPAPFKVDEYHIDVSMEPQKWDSGSRCSVGNHYDTVMYAYVNPFSTWKFTPIEYSSPTCESRSGGSQKNLGCNINNNQGGGIAAECGKVVNLLVFQAEQDGTLHRVCGLNTHMSFAGTAQQRMTFINEAMKETESARCDSVFFVGDFNTRLHCEDGEKQVLPPFERSEGGKTSLDHILDKHCQNIDTGKCTMKDSAEDELNQIIGSERIRCYEKVDMPSDGSWFGKSKKGWSLTTTENPVSSIGLREAAPPEFPPSYKLAEPKTMAKHKAWGRCFEGDSKCFYNPSGSKSDVDWKGKHNPAWTDRVLMRSSNKGVQFDTKAYLRVPSPEGFKSDHAGVVARVVIKMP